MRDRERRSLFLAVNIAVVIALDQASKHAVLARLAPGRSHDVVPNLLSFEFVANFHGGYGLLASGTWAVVSLAAVVLALFATALRDLIWRSPLAGFAFGLATGGAFGNIIDRLHYGYVVDFVTLPPLPILEVFNFADLCIIAGVPLLIIANLTDERA